MRETKKNLNCEERNERRQEKMELKLKEMKKKTGKNYYKKLNVKVKAIFSYTIEYWKNLNFCKRKIKEK